MVLPFAWLRYVANQVEGSRQVQLSRSADFLGSGFGNRRGALKGTMSTGIHGPPEEALGVERDFKVLRLD